jgi:Holliday junction resolvase RusA-like endonuclease
MLIEFEVSGEPKGQPRPKAFSRGGHASVYDPKTAEGWKSQIALAAREHLPATPISGPVSASFSFYMPRPKHHFGSGKNAGKLKANAPDYFISKPDADNLAKAAMDALTQLRVFHDDCLIVNLNVTKRYENPMPGCGRGCRVRIEVMN